MDWVGREILPYEAQCRAWLRRTLDPDDLEDVIQEAYCRIAELCDVRHVRSGKAYFFTTARMIVLERLRRARIVRIEAIAEIEELDIVSDEPSPERMVASHRDLRRVRQLIEQLPDRCRRVVSLRKIDGLSQREVAARLGLAEHTVEYEVGRGLKLLLRALAEDDSAADTAFSDLGNDKRTPDSNRHQ